MDWSLINTKPHEEERAEQNLRRLGIKVFCPRVKERKRIRRQMREVVRPFFPGYLFARFDPIEHYPTVKYTPGVKHVLTSERWPTPVNEWIIKAIRFRCEEGYLRQDNQPRMPKEGSTKDSWDSLVEKFTLDQEFLKILDEEKSPDRKIQALLNLASGKPEEK